MILVSRGNADGDGAERLAAIEARALTDLRAIVLQEQRDPTSNEIERYDYKVAGTLLCKRQGWKCAYCEHREQRLRNDVEHFRPKGRALRGWHSEAHGYWWLAWRWDNLLFACRNCNQALSEGRGKLDRFPLEEGSGVLVAEQDPYGADAGVERPLLLDPSEDSGVEHIEFRRVQVSKHEVQWRPFARHGSVRGDMTIWLCGLDRDGLVEAYERHVAEEVQPRVQRFEGLHPFTSDAEVRRVWTEIEFELYRLGMPFVGLSYDALRTLVPDEDLNARGLTRRLPR
ncbi:MAG: hypothetical protein IPF99_36755 [Deltaproteobacteria bacterium]|nr:hypothetical protein [Deltaproteobacteria bacterium]